MVAPRGHFDPEDDGRNIFRPPAIPTEVTCVHCGQVYESYLIEWREDAGPQGDPGAWCCPTPGCDGLGFLFDIWPTDPEWCDEYGNKVCCFGEETEDFDDLEPDPDGWLDLPLRFAEDNFDFGFSDPDEYIPDEMRNAPAKFDPTWGDLANNLPPDPRPPRRPDRSDSSIDEDDIPF